MSKPTRWALVCAAFIAACALVIACARGDSGISGDDVVEPMDAPAVTHMDANVSVMVDAPPPKMDGSIVVPDAAPPPPDAPPGSLFCSMNSDCTMAGQCCFAIGGQGFCVNGTIFLGACIPQ